MAKKKSKTRTRTKSSAVSTTSRKARASTAGLWNIASSANSIMGGEIVKLLVARKKNTDIAEDDRLLQEILEWAKGQVKQKVIEDKLGKAVPNLEDLFNLELAFAISTSVLPGYATLDAKHIKGINDAITEIEKYCIDPSKKRPINFMLNASPGAGKSHFVGCIAKRMKTPYRIESVGYNMATMENYSELAPALDEARNLKVDDKMPLLFLDEFDTEPSFYALLLPLMWDGEVNLGDRKLRIGRCIIVLAGSDEKLRKELKNARRMEIPDEIDFKDKKKLPDLISRINGGEISIPPFSDSNRNIARKPDKVCIAVALLRKKFGKDLTTVPVAFLRFVARTYFQHGVRSIEHLVGELPFETRSKLSFNQDIPEMESQDSLLESNLAYHLGSSTDVRGVHTNWTGSWANNFDVSVGVEHCEIFVSTNESDKITSHSVMARLSQIRAMCR